VKKTSVSIQVNGKQIYPEGHEDQQELSTVGTFYERNGIFYLFYKESDHESTGLGDVTTLLTIKEGLVALYRKGAVNLAQEFKKGVLDRSIYTTCYGEIMLSVMPRRVEFDLTVYGGRINLEYDLFVEDKLVSYNLLVLNIKEDLPQ